MAKILIVDDDPSIRSAVARILRSGDHEFLFANDGRQALEVFAKENPELVITDMIMPEMSGLKTIHELLKQSPTTKIIAMSGVARSGATDLLPIAEKLGAGAILSKPFDPEELTAAVSHCLGTASRER